MAEALSKVSAKTAKDIYQHYNIDEECVALDTEGLSPEKFIDVLIENERYEHAVAFLAHALPRRESVWWACISARSIMTEGGDATLEAALKAAERWVFEPTEKHRREAEMLAEKTKYKHPASWAAVAAFWSGDSVTDEGEPPVPPPAYLYAHAVSGAVTLSAVGTDPDGAPDRFKLFIRQGLDIANGGNGRVS